eukprot:TRINITY_DN1421_c0_g1_i2.p1 TRINITY_DN1421_c0_g1~~TRINITY_DN1421_c0_g1_i2.p1  ORF type:complete len:315 (+),score=16.75 TRINITY_DN1421_c0_g1_i2:62-1006(+)
MGERYVLQKLIEDQLQKQRAHHHFISCNFGRNSSCEIQDSVLGFGSPAAIDDKETAVRVASLLHWWRNGSLDQNNLLLWRKPRLPILSNDDLAGLGRTEISPNSIPRGKFEVFSPKSNGSDWIITPKSEVHSADMRCRELPSELEEDGVTWKKYSQRVLAGGHWRRFYFKCMKNDCNARKHVDILESWRSRFQYPEDEKLETIRNCYIGEHNHKLEDRFFPMQSKVETRSDTESQQRLLGSKSSREIEEMSTCDTSSSHIVISLGTTSTSICSSDKVQISAEQAPKRLKTGERGKVDDGCWLNLTLGMARSDGP